MSIRLLLCGLIVGSVALANTGAPPTEMRMPGATEPTWIAASQVLTSAGVVRDSVDASTRKIVQARALKPTVAAAAGPCEDAFFRPYHGATDRPYLSVSALLRNAEAAYRGTITHATPGFSRGMPVTLLTVLITQTGRRTDEFPENGSVYVEFRGADFALAGARYCNRSPITGYSPAIGDEVVIFAFNPPRDTSGRFLYTAPEHLVFAKDGRLLAADGLSNREDLEGLTADELILLNGYERTRPSVRRER
jgi:hypothetical protein